MATIYVDKDGVGGTPNDSNPGTVVTSPKETILSAYNAAVAGDVIELRMATYTGLFLPAKSGTAGNPITIQNFTAEVATIVPPVSGFGFVFTETGAGTHYITLKGQTLGGLVLDRNGVSSNDAIRVNGGGSAGKHNSNIQLINLILTDWGIQCGACDTCLLQNITISGSGGGTTHGIYMPGANTTVEKCRVSGRAGWGIHVWNYWGLGNVIRNNRCWSNGGDGIVVGHDGSAPGGVHVYQNACFENTLSGIALVHGDANEAVHNVCHNNGGWGIEVGGFGAPDNDVVRNNQCEGNTSGSIKIFSAANSTIVTHNYTDTAIVNLDTSATVNNNLTGLVDTTEWTDPNNVTLASRDYTNKTGVTSIDAGIAIGYVTLDPNGVTRPQGAAVDMGAYEISAAPPSAPLVTHTSPYVVVAGEYTAVSISLQDEDENVTTLELDSAGTSSLKLTVTTGVTVDI